MARTNQQHLERARVKLNALHEEIEQAKLRLIAKLDEAAKHGQEQIAKLQAKLDKLKSDIE